MSVLLLRVVNSRVPSCVTVVVGTTYIHDSDGNGNNKWFQRGERWMAPQMQMLGALWLRDCSKQDLQHQVTKYSDIQYTGSDVCLVSRCDALQSQAVMIFDFVRSRPCRADAPFIPKMPHTVDKLENKVTTPPQNESMSGNGRVQEDSALQQRQALIPTLFLAWAPHRA